MSLSFEPITLERQDAYRERLALMPQVASDYSFVNIWGWREEYGMEWAFDDRLVWLRQTRPETAYWAPVGAWSEVGWKGLESFLSGRRFIRVPETLAERWLNVLSPDVREARGHWDYVYTIRDLMELEGPRYAKKRGLLESFKREYDWSYHEMSMDCVEEAEAMQQTWCKWRDCESNSTLEAENRAIAQVLENWDRLPGLLGGAIRVDDRIIAYTVADAITEDTLVIHFEKAHTSFSGAYQAINQMFLADKGRGFRLVNREQDLDDAGLRKAKLSYNPVDFVRKFTLGFSG